MRTILFLTFILTCTLLKAQWTSHNLGWTWESVRALYFMNATQGYAAGDYGAFAKTTDGGITWTDINPGSLYIINGIYFFDNNNGLFVNNNSEIRKTTNGGSTWTSVYTQSNVQLQDITFINSTTGIAVGGEGGICTVLKSTNGGSTWAAQTVNGYYGWLWDVEFSTSTTGYAVGIAGAVIKSTDGGATWNLQTTGVTEWLRGVSFIDANTGYASGDGGVILKTTNGGTTWVQQTSGTTADIYAVKFINANTGYAVCSNGYILKTVNGGTTWTVNYTASDGFLKISIPTSSVAYAGSILGNVYKNSNLTGVENTYRNKFNIELYPNPCSNSFFMDITSGNEMNNVVLRIIDVTGREMLSHAGITSGKTEINTENLTGGIYYFSVSDDSGPLYTGKFVKE